MPTTVRNLFESAGIELTGVVRWGEKPRSRICGIYVISMSSTEHENRCVLVRAPISLDIIESWINRVNTIELDRKSSPSSEEIADRLSKFWLPDESILYIGKTSSKLSGRVGAFYRTQLGDKKPHRGGHWIKTLTILNSLYVYFAETTDPHNIEDVLLESFMKNVSQSTLDTLFDPARPFPFANLEYPKGKIKRHGLNKTTLA